MQCFAHSALKHVPLEEEEDQVFGSNTIPSVEKYAQPERGFQGHQNSCYLDATVFGLFALNDVFDSLFLNMLFKHALHVPPFITIQ